MRRSVRVLAPAMLVMVMLVGCSLVVSTGDLAGGASAGNDAAGAVGSRDGEVADSAREGSTFAGDSGVDAEETSVTGCVDGPGRFCTGFDEADPAARWTRSYKSRGQVAFDAPGVSAPNALRAQITSGTGEGSAALEKDVPADTSAFRCELDLKLDTFPSGAADEIDVFNITATVANGSTHNIYMAAFGGTWMLAEYHENKGIDRTVDIGSLPTATWLHVVLETAKTSATLTVDGRSVTLDALTIPSKPSGRGIHVGISYASPPIGTAAVHADNVDCTYSAN